MEEKGFDLVFFENEKKRFDNGLHDGKKEIIKKKVLPHLKDKTVLDFGCGGGNYSKMFSLVAKKVYGLDNVTALSFAKNNNSFSNIEYTNEAPKTEVTIFFDCLEFIPNWKEIYDKHKSPLNFVICPNFQAINPRLVRLLKKFSFKKKKMFAEIKKIEGGRYHSLYNREFIKEFESYIKNFEKIPFTRTLYPLHFFAPAHESFLYIIKEPFL